MNSNVQNYLDLLTTLRSFIQQEYPPKTWISTDLETYRYFLEIASKLNPKSTDSPKTTNSAPHPKKIEVVAENVTITEGSPLRNQSPASSHDLKKVVQPPRSPLQENVSVQQIAVRPPFIENSAVPLNTPSQNPPLHPFKTPSATPEKTVLPSKKFIRENASLSTPSDFSEIRAFFGKHLPDFALSDSIADDSHAKERAAGWNRPPAEILILSFNEASKEQAFIHHLACAMNLQLASTQILPAGKIENEIGWEKVLKTGKLRLVVASNYNLHTLPGLLKHFHEDANGRHTLGNTSLFLLSDLSLYMQQPSLKASLWKSLCQFFQ